MGIFEAGLGQNLFKKRIPRPGGGKRSGFRTIVAFKSSDNEKVFFMYGFAKNERDNITEKETDGLGVIAKYYLEASEAVLNNLLKDGELIEVDEVQENE